MEGETGLGAIDDGWYIPDECCFAFEQLSLQIIDTCWPEFQGQGQGTVVKELEGKVIDQFTSLVDNNPDKSMKEVADMINSVQVPSVAVNFMHINNVKYKAYLVRDTGSTTLACTLKKQLGYGQSPRQKWGLVHPVHSWVTAFLPILVLILTLSLAFPVKASEQDQRFQLPDFWGHTAPCMMEHQEGPSHCRCQLQLLQDTPAEFKDPNPVTRSRAGSAVPISPEDQGTQPSLEAEEKGSAREVRPEALSEAGTGELRRLSTGKVNKLLSLSEYIDTLKRKPKRTLKTERERKKWLKENVPELKFVKHPSTGKDSIPVEQDMLMLVGTKTSSSRSKDQKFDTKEEAKEAAKRARVDEDLEQYQSKGDDEAEKMSESGDASDAESKNSFSLGQSDSEDDAAAKRRSRARGTTDTKQKEARESSQKSQKAEKESEQKDKETKEPKEPPKAASAKAKESKAVKAKQDRAEKLWVAAKKAKGTLDEVTADMIWRSVVRAGELDRRLQKAQQTEADLRAFVDSEGTSFFGQQKNDVEPFLQTLSQVRESITDFKDICREIRAVTPEDFAKEISEGGSGELTRLLPKIVETTVNNEDHATFLDMLCFLVKKLHTVTWMSHLASL
eukprot:s45_g21.t1